MITQYDFTRIGLDVEYVYYLNEEEQPHTQIVFSGELIEFIKDNGLANILVGDYESTATPEQLWDYLMDNYDSVARQYWKEFLEGEVDDEP